MLVEAGHGQRPEPNNLNVAAGPLDNMRALRQAIGAGSGSVVQRSDVLDLNPNRLGNIQETISLPCTTARILVRGGSSELLIAEPVDLEAVQPQQLVSDIERFAVRLRHVNPGTFNMLQCEGIIQQADPQYGRLTSLEVVYRALSPTSQPPTTLRQLLLDQQRTVSLTSIVNLAKQLVRSVSYMHTWYVFHPTDRPRKGRAREAPD